MKILIVGYFGYKNIGDDAMLAGFQEYIKPNDGLIINVLKSDTTKLQAIKYFVEADKIVLCGGTHLRNWGSKWLWQSARIVALAIASRLSAKGFYMINVGIDGASLLKIAKLATTGISNRDTRGFDSAVLIPFFKKTRKKIIGINLTPVNGIYFNKLMEDWKLILSMSKALNSWQKVNPGWKIKFFSFNGNSKYNDNDLCRFAVAMTDNSEYEPYQADIKKTIEDISECSGFIGMRFHACLFAYMTGTPVIMINSYPSVVKLAKRIGISCIEQDGNFKQAIADLVNNGRYDLNKSLSIIKAQMLAREGIDIIWK